MTDTPSSIRKDFSTWLSHQPEEIRPHGRSIVENLKLLSREVLGEQDRAVALIALQGNVAKFEKKRAELRSLMPNGHSINCNQGVKS